VHLKVVGGRVLDLAALSRNAADHHALAQHIFYSFDDILTLDASLRLVLAVLRLIRMCGRIPVSRVEFGPAAFSLFGISSAARQAGSGASSNATGAPNTAMIPVARKDSNNATVLTHGLVH
jgi:hypothetical protein